MAASGSFEAYNYKASTQGYKYRLTVYWVQTRNEAYNTSTLDFRFRLHKQAGTISTEYIVATIGGNIVNIPVDTPPSAGDAYYIGTYSYTIAHDNDGTKTFDMSFNYNLGNSYGYILASATGITLEPNSPVSTAIMPSTDIGSSATITIQRNSSTNKVGLTYSFGSETGTILAPADDTGPSDTSNLETTTTWDVPSALAEQIPNATSGNGVLTCSTYAPDGSTLINTTTSTFTLTVPSSTFKPKIGSLTATNSGSDVSHDWGVFVQSKSSAIIAMQNVVAYGGATIQSYSISGGSFSGNTNSLSIPSFPSSGTITFTATVTDSRGYTSDAKECEITVCPYSVPGISNYSAYRCDSEDVSSDDGTYIRLGATFSYAPCSVNNEPENNSVTATVKYKQSTANSWTDANVDLTSGGSVVFGGGNISTDNSYDVQITLKDSFNTTTTTVIQIPTASVLMDFLFGGKGLAIGKVAEYENTLEVAWDTRLNGTTYIGTSDVGNATTPIYLDGGVVTSCSASIPTSTSQLTNDSGFITTSDIPEGAAASTTTPKMDGTAATGSELAFARGDHIHPTDTSRAPISHASTATTYGKGTGSNYGHLKLSDSTSSTSSTSGGIAATPAAVKAAYDLADSKAPVIHSHDSATSSNAGFMSATDKEKVDSFLDQDQYLAWRGYAVDVSNTLSDIMTEGHYQILTDDLSSITDLPSDHTGKGSVLIVMDASTQSITRCWQLLIDNTDGGLWQRWVSTSSGVGEWTNMTGQYGSSDLAGRNLIKHTLAPDVSSNSALPMLVDQSTNTVVTSGALTVAEHGFRLTNTAKTRPIIRFGSDSVSTGTMEGLIAGETYTMSFDYSTKMYSGYTGSDTYLVRAYLYSDAVDATTFTVDAFENIARYTSGSYGNEMSGSVAFTFTIPSNATMIDFRIQPNATTASYFPAGDYIELSNLKLEKGHKATSWFPALEDFESISNGFANCAPISHASTATTYGKGTSSDYGHVKLSDSTSSTSSTSGGIAATPAAVKAAYDLANSKTANTGTVTSVSAGDGLTGGSITTSGTISVSYGTSTPAMDSTGAVGTATTVARSDHVHPTDTSRAPTSHASTGTTYGKGTSSNYGHVKLSDATNGTSAAASGGTAATPKAVADALTAAKSYADGVSANDFTDTLKSKLDGIEAGAQVNTVTSVNSKTGAVSLTYSDVGAAASSHGTHVTYSTTNPVMDGTAAVGTASTVARSDHVHPTDTSRAPTSHASSATTYGTGTASNYGHLKLSDSTSSTSSTNGGTAATPAAVKAAYDLANSKTSNTGTVTSVATGNGLTGGTITTSGTIAVSYGTTTPAMNGTGAVGTATTVARSDHVHPTDTSRAAAVHSHDAATTSAAGYMSAADKTKLDEFLDENQYMAWRGFAQDYSTTLSDILESGEYSINSGHIASITDLPSDYPENGGLLVVMNSSDTTSYKKYWQLLIDNGSGGIWQRYVSTDTAGVGAWVNVTGQYGSSDLIGRNLIKHTLVPNVSSKSTLPMLIGQSIDTVVTSGDLSVSEHGFRLTNTANTRPIIRFGSSSVASGTMEGLTAGETYTMSFDYKCQMYSGYTGSDTYLVRVYLYSDAQDSTTFSIDEYINIARYVSGTYGDEQSGSLVFTFTIPSNATMIDFRIQPNATTASYFPAGDYIELSNLKLEKGHKATSWFPALEDFELIGNSIAGNNRTTEFEHFTVKTNLTWPDVSSTGTNNTELASDTDVLCVLALPTNYSPTGTPTPLIMFGHGASCQITDDSWYGNSANFLAMIRAFTAAGYAVFDVNNTRDQSGGFPDWGSLPLMTAYIHAWEYIKENYNVEKRLYLLSDSMGTAANLNMLKWYPGEIITSLMTAPRPVCSARYAAQTDATVKANMATAFGLSGTEWESDRLKAFDHAENIFYINDTGFVFEKLPPVKVMVGTADTDFLTETRAYYKALANAGNYVNYREVSGATHANMSFLYTEGMRTEAVAWFDRFRANKPIVFTLQPSDVSCASGATVSFNISASGNGITYQWQYSTDGGSTWKNNSGTGYNTPTFSFTAASSYSGRKYRCKVTDSDGIIAISNPATITVT